MFRLFRILRSGVDGDALPGDSADGVSVVGDDVADSDLAEHFNSIIVLFV